MKKLFVILVASLFAIEIFTGCKMPNSNNEKIIYKEIYRENFDILEQISKKLGTYISLDLYAPDSEYNIGNKKWIIRYSNNKESYSVWIPEGNLTYLKDFTNTKRIEKMSDVASFAVYLLPMYEGYGTGNPSYFFDKIGNILVEANVMFSYENYEKTNTPLQIKNDYYDLLNEGR